MDNEPNFTFESHAEEATPPSILVVDDDKGVRDATAFLLHSERFMVIAAATGADALRLAGNNPDLIVLDVKLPDMGGFDVCRRLKADPTTKPIPVLMLSGVYRDDVAKVIGLESGADGYLTKGGDPAVLIATVKSLLRMRRAETAARRSEARLRAIIEAEPECVMLMAADGRLLDINAAGVTIFEADSPAAIVGRGAQEFVAPAFADAFREMLRTAGETAPAHLTYQLVGLQGGHRWLETHAVALPDDGAAEVILAVSRDITERKRAEDALELQARELARSNAELERFAYVVSHDLQEPLRIIISYLQLLAKRYVGRLDGDADEFIGYAVDGASRMQGLIRDMLEYSRVGTRGDAFTPVDIEAVFQGVLDNLELTIEEAGARVTHEPLPTVVGDAGQLTRLLQNLVSNAVKFHGERPPEVHVAARPESGAWVFSVRDNGVGIDPQYHDRLFKMFERLPSATVRPGTGIGLAICKKIIERHGGRIWVESQPGAGATFYFTIPQRQPA